MTTLSPRCRVTGCGRRLNSTSLCRTHREREMAGLSVDDYVIKSYNPARGCSVAGCTRSHHSKDLCYKHYLRKYSGVPLDAYETDVTRFKGQECLVLSCISPAGGERGLCKWHTNWSGKYGFSVVQTLHILNSPTSCDICGENVQEGRINVDHDHSCCPGQQTCGNCLRGILCRGCNRAIGSFRENPQNIYNAYTYLTGSNRTRLDEY